jgi:hypothetical protein
LRQNDQSSIDLSTNPGLKLHQIKFSWEQSVSASTVTIVGIFKEALSNCNSSMNTFNFDVTDRFSTILDLVLVTIFGFLDYVALNRAPSVTTQSRSVRGASG